MWEGVSGLKFQQAPQKEEKQNRKAAHKSQ
jgi:hypothetical protein